MWTNPGCLIKTEMLTLCSTRDPARNKKYMHTSDWSGRRRLNNGTLSETHQWWQKQNCGLFVKWQLNKIEETALWVKDRKRHLRCPRTHTHILSWCFCSSDQLPLALKSGPARLLFLHWDLSLCLFKSSGGEGCLLPSIWRNRGQLWLRESVTICGHGCVHCILMTEMNVCWRHRCALQ